MSVTLQLLAVLVTIGPCFSDDAVVLTFDPKLALGINIGANRSINLNYTNNVKDNLKLLISNYDNKVASVDTQEMTLQLCDGADNSSCAIEMSITGKVVGRTHLEFSYEISTFGKNVSSETSINVVSNATLEVTIVPAHAGILSVFGKSLIACLVILNFVFGCKLDIHRVVAYFRKPQQIALGYSCQFLLMPSIAFSLAKLFRLSNILSIALLLSGSAPGGHFSNIIVVFLDGDIDLSITLTLLSTVLAFGSMPLWVFVYGRFFMSGPYTVAPPYVEMIIAIAASAIPLGIGLLIRRCRPSVADKIAKYVKVVCLIMALAAMSMLIFNLQYYLPLVTWRRALASVILFPTGMALSFLISLLLRQTLIVAKTIAVETAIQNNLLVFAVVNTNLGPPDSYIMTTMPMLGAIVLLMILILTSILHKCLMKWNTRYRMLHSTKESRDQDDDGTSPKLI